MPATTQPARASTAFPDALGRFVPETLMDALNQMAEAYDQAKADPAFQATLNGYLADYVGRPSPLFRDPALVGSGRPAQPVFGGRPNP